jgi:Tfp pilus assembly protein PilF
MRPLPTFARIRPRWSAPAPVRLLLAALLVLALTSAAGCRRQPHVSEETYRAAVSAFHVSLAAMQTSQDVLAREELERLTQLVPHEPAGWANLGLLHLRQQQIEEGAELLTRASELAPNDAALERLLALADSLRGHLDQSIVRWRRASELDPADLRAPFALAQELERRGGDGEAEAQRILATLAARSGNLAVLVEHARMAAKRGDAASLESSLASLEEASAGWPEEAREELQAVRDAARRGPAEATTPVIFLRNVLLRAPEYRAAQAALTTPRAEVGEPMMAFVILPNPPPHAATPDEGLRFAVDASAAVASAASSWAGAVWLIADAPPAPAAASAHEISVGGAVLPFPGGAAATPPGPDGVLAADLDSDFRTDLVLAGAGGLRLFRQEEQGTFAEATGAARLPDDVARGALAGVWAADIDTDGDLDLVVARADGAPVVLQNNGDGTFSPVSPFDGVTRLRGFAWADLDGEGVPDAVLLDQQGVIRIFLNLRGGAFREHPLPEGFPAVAAITVADVTGNGLMDAVAVTAAGLVVRLSWTGDGWTSAEVMRADVPRDLTPGNARLLTADLDNNGAFDLIVAGPAWSRILLGAGAGVFHALPEALPLYAFAAADLDGNGRLDLVGPAGGGAHVARSSGAQQYHWQAMRPRAATATGDQRVNSFGFGGEVEIRTGLHAQKQVIASPVVHFGLGEAREADVARITWPNGVLQSEFALAADTVIPASQRLKGSCPWLFAWNGRDMSFVTDFIWRSPLGLRINAQESADVLMTEDWVRLRRDQLAPRDGFYDLRITAELWETHFFDMVSLVAVDHPEGTEVFVDERFAVPPPPFEPVATDPVQEFRSVRNDAGGDVAHIVRARDDRHLDFAGRGRYQGVTRDHFVELELPDSAPRSGPLWLVAQGWVHPTDSSINVALGQGAHALPTGLSLHVAEAGGRFREVRSGLGFPAGKDKTILIDLTGVFPATGPRRLRLQTNMEIFWDRLGWAVGRPDVRLEPRRIELASAELRYRGFSVTEQRDASTPERPRYVIEGTAARWRDLEGFHTRFGDVRELLHQVDDRYVIMNAGDEMLLRFREMAPPPEGLLRDFVLIGDGWVKDGDFNTTASRTVLPLPTHGSAAYEPGSGRLEDDPVFQQHRADFERYHTRYVSPEVPRDALRLSPGDFVRPIP